MFVIRLTSGLIQRLHCSLFLVFILLPFTMQSLTHINVLPVLPIVIAVGLCLLAVILFWPFTVIVTSVLKQMPT